MLEVRKGEPCSHPGRLNQVSHTCEVCGKIGGIRDIVSNVSVKDGELCGVISNSHISLFDFAKILLAEIRESCNFFKNAGMPIPEHLWNAQRYSAGLVSSLEKYLGRDYKTK